MFEMELGEVGRIAKMAAQDRPRLIVIDHNDPEAALDTCRALTSNDETGAIPVLLVSDGNIDIDAGRQAGAGHVLQNNALLTDLSPIVRHLLEESTALIYVLEEVAGRTDELVSGLRSKGFIVIPHSSAQALTRAIEQQEPRMLILDITRGVERLCQQFKTDPATAQCPIVLTAEGAVASSREAHSVGADYYLTKANDTVMLAAMLLSK